MVLALPAADAGGGTAELIAERLIGALPLGGRPAPAPAHSPEKLFSLPNAGWDDLIKLAAVAIIAFALISYFIARPSLTPEGSVHAPLADDQSGRPAQPSPTR